MRAVCGRAKALGREVSAVGDRSQTCASLGVRTSTCAVLPAGSGADGPRGMGDVVPESTGPADTPVRWELSSG